MDSRCCATKPDGAICCDPATIPDPVRGGMVCAIHAPSDPNPDPEDYVDIHREQRAAAADRAFFHGRHGGYGL